jgi:hypothetical protein
MDEKLKDDIKKLENFFEAYCKANHTNQTDCNGIELCEKCSTLLQYTYKKLDKCQYKPEEKPKCRKCPNNCYDRKEKKELAKVMSFGAMLFGLSKIKNKIKQLLK